jgi:spore coat polysaccharide biosynthesis protein SpsF
MTALILQARMDSSRLPGKALRSLRGETLLFLTMSALKTIPCGVHILACPEDCVSLFAAHAERAGFEIYAGPKEDVLARYCGAARKFKPDRIIRATGDNPFVFADAAVELNKEADALGADYAGYSGLPYGAGVESVCAEALLRAEREAVQPFEREHVCPYLYNHPEIFKLHRPLCPTQWQSPDMRVTIDTLEDYEKAAVLHNALSLLDSSERFLGKAIIETYRRVL